MSHVPYDPLVYTPPRFRRQIDGSEAVSENERRVLSLIWKSGGLARSALVPKLGLTQQSIHRIVTQLQARNMIEFGQLEPPAYKGKPSPRLCLNPRFAMVAGISIDTDSAGVAIMNFAGQKQTRSFSIDGMGMDRALLHIAASIDAMLEEAGTTRADLFGIGFAIAGFMVADSQYNAPEPLAEWSALPLGPYLTEVFGLPVWTENGANAGAVCEQMFGVGRNVNNFVYLSFNYGFGGGVILNGDLIRGGFGNAGELSGMFSEAESTHRPALRSLLEMLQANGVKVDSITDLSQRFDITWPGVEAWLERVTPQHNRITNVLSAVVDPEVIVFGGQIPPRLAEALIARTEFWNTPRHGTCRRMPRLCLSTVKRETAAIGAASLALKAGFF